MKAMECLQLLPNGGMKISFRHGPSHGQNLRSQSNQHAASQGLSLARAVQSDSFGDFSRAWTIEATGCGAEVPALRSCGLGAFVPNATSFSTWRPWFPNRTSPPAKINSDCDAASRRHDLAFERRTLEENLPWGEDGQIGGVRHNKAPQGLLWEVAKRNLSTLLCQRQGRENQRSVRRCDRRSGEVRLSNLCLRLL